MDTDFVLFALIFHCTLFAALRQADFLYHALTLRFTQWIIIRLTQTGTTNLDHSSSKMVHQRRLVVKC